MDISHVVVRLVLALISTGIANILIPRQIPGKILGMILIGLLGTWLGEWTFQLLRQNYGLDYVFLSWQIQRVPIIPSILGSTIVLYVITSFLKWGRYSNR